MGWVRSHNSSDFEEPLEIIDLSGCHGEKNEGLEEGPHHNAGVSALVNRPVDAFTQIHVILFMLDSTQSSGKLFDHLFQLGMITIFKYNVRFEYFNEFHLK